MAFAALGQGDEAAALLSLLNPINHARSRAGVWRYRAEAYVVAADVYLRSASRRTRRLDLGALRRLGRMDAARPASKASWGCACKAACLSLRCAS